MQRLKEENALLGVMATEDAKEMKRLRTEVEVAQSENEKLRRDILSLQTLVDAQQQELGRLAESNFKEQVIARTSVRNAYSEKLSSLEEERALLVTQSEMDNEVIRGLQRSLHEVMFERDALAKQLDLAAQERDDAVVRVALMEEHSNELRASNVSLANRVAELEELVTIYENESHADFFTRYSKREIAAGKLISRGSDSSRVGSAVSSARSEGGARPVQQVSMGSCSALSKPTAGTNSGSGNATAPKGAAMDHKATPPSMSFSPTFGSPSAGNPEVSPISARVLQLQSSPANQPKVPTELPPRQRGPPKEVLPIVDALSGKQMKSQSTSFNSSLGPPAHPQGKKGVVLNRPVYSDDEDDEDSPSHPASSAAPSRNLAQGSQAKRDSSSSSEVSEAPFKTIREKKGGPLQAKSGPGFVGGANPSNNIGSPQQLLSPPMQDNTRLRPQTTPLSIEAIYGEKGLAKDKMYLVKFVNVESEQWTSADFVDQNCEALKTWKRSRIDRSHLPSVSGSL